MKKKLIAMFAAAVTAAAWSATQTVGGYEWNYLQKIDGTVEIANNLVVTFDGNGGKAKKTSVSIKKNAAIGTLPSATRTGYTFKGWFTKKSGGTKITKTTKVTKTVTYYAQWTANKYKIAFDKNGGKGSAPKTVTATYGKDMKLPACKLTRAKYTFKGWSTSKKATTAQYKDKAKVKNVAASGTVKLYAVWAPDQYTLILDPNGATGAKTIKAVNCGDKVKLTNSFKRDGFTFKGWATKKNGKVVYANGKSVKDLAKKGKSITLYAVWAMPNWAVGSYDGSGEYEVDAWGKRASYDFVFTVAVAESGKLTGTVTVDVTAGKQEKASFTAASPAGYKKTTTVDFWYTWDYILQGQQWVMKWSPECRFTGPAFCYDVDFKLHGVTKRHRLYIFDMSKGTVYDDYKECFWPKGVATAAFTDADLASSVFFSGDARKNLWTDKSYTGPLPKFAKSTITKTVSYDTDDFAGEDDELEMDEGDVYTFTFKQNGTVAISIVRKNGNKDSASCAAQVEVENGGKSFRVGLDWIFPKGSASAAFFRMKPNKKGVITADDIEVWEIGNR